MWKRSDVVSAPQASPAVEPQAQAESSRQEPLRAAAEAGPVTPNLGRSVVITGELTSSEDLRIEGRVNGSIESKQHTVVVGHHARIKATILAKEVVVFGKVMGNVTATDKIQVREEGTIEGDLASPTVSIAEGAVFRGSIDMTRQSAESAA